MKRVDWQRVYVPRGAALDIRVRRTLRTLSDAPDRRTNMNVSMKRRIAWAVCAVLALASAVALAAGLLFSDRVDVQARAEQTLAQRYGLTQDMLSVFSREVDEAAGTVTFTPLGEASDRLGERLGTYSVTVSGGEKTAVWSHDGESVGSDLSSPVWDAGLLGQALERRAAGEAWFEILCSDAELAVNVTEDNAEALARQAVAERYGANALDGFVLEDVNAHVSGEQEMAASGHGIWQYTVCFARTNGTAGTVERYFVELYADDGSAAYCGYEVEEGAASPGDAAEPNDQAVPDVPEEIISLARTALAQRYALTQVQQDAMTPVEEWFCIDRDGEKPVYQVWFWLWQSEDETWREGNGMYGAYVNADTGVIEETFYDNTLGGNG